MSKIDERTLNQIQELFLEYEREVRVSRYSSNSISMRIGYVRNFVGWLAGKWSPLDYDGSQSQ